VPLDVCTSEVCEQSQRAGFVLDPVVRSFSVLATAPMEGVQARLWVPGATAGIELPHPAPGTAADGEQTLDKVISGAPPVRYRWVTSQTVRVTMTSTPGQAWDGQWWLALVDPQRRGTGARGQAHIHLNSGLKLAPAGEDKVTARSADPDTALDLVVATIGEGKLQPVAEVPVGSRIDIGVRTADDAVAVLAEGRPVNTPDQRYPVTFPNVVGPATCS
jgi:hypothetical protein